MMRIKITEPGIFGAGGMDLVGTTLVIRNEPPAGWKGKYVVLTDEPDEKAVPIVNDEPKAISDPDPLDHDGDGRKGGSLPAEKRRGRPRKDVAEGGE